MPTREEIAAKHKREKGFNRTAQVLTKRSNRYSSQEDDSINAGLDDEEDSKSQQQQIQEARKNKDWAKVKKLSETWQGVTGSKRRAFGP